MRTKFKRFAITGRIRNNAKYSASLIPRSLSFRRQFKIAKSERKTTKLARVKRYHDGQELKLRKTCVSGVKAAVMVPRGKFDGLLASCRGMFGSRGKREITRIVVRNIAPFAMSAKRRGNLLSKNLSAGDLARSKL